MKRSRSVALSPCLALCIGCEPSLQTTNGRLHGPNLPEFPFRELSLALFCPDSVFSVNTLTSCLLRTRICPLFGSREKFDERRENRTTRWRKILILLISFVFPRWLGLPNRKLLCFIYPLKPLKPPPQATTSLPLSHCHLYPPRTSPITAARAITATSFLRGSVDLNIDFLGVIKRSKIIFRVNQIIENEPIFLALSVEKIWGRDKWSLSYFPSLIVLDLDPKKKKLFHRVQRKWLCWGWKYFFSFFSSSSPSPLFLGSLSDQIDSMHWTLFRHRFANLFGCRKKLEKTRVKQDWS